MIRQKGFTTMTCLLVLSLSLYISAQTASPSEKVKARVLAYYAAVQSNQVAKAQEFVIQKSRATFFPQFDNKLVGIRVAQVDLEPGKESAIVKVVCQVMIPTAMQAVDVPQYSRWKLSGGDWFFDPADPPKSLASLFQEYYWKKQAARNSRFPDQPAPPIDVQFESETKDFGVVVKGTTVTLKFAFTNMTKKDLFIERIFLHEHLMKDATTERMIAPGKKGEIVLNLDTSPLYREVEHDVFVQFEPIREIVKLKIKGKVFTAKDLVGYRPNS